jgi:hypothetical protein
MCLADLSSVLWQEREVLELLVFKLEQRKLVLNSGCTRWLGHATREVDLVACQLRGTEVLRAVEVETVATELGLGSGPSLARIVHAAPAPWSPLLSECRDQLVSLCAEITVNGRVDATKALPRLPGAGTSRQRGASPRHRVGVRNARNAGPAVRRRDVETSPDPAAPATDVPAVPLSLLDFLR